MDLFQPVQEAFATFIYLFILDDKICGLVTKVLFVHCRIAEIWCMQMFLKRAFTLLLHLTPLAFSCLLLENKV